MLASAPGRMVAMGPEPSPPNSGFAGPGGWTLMPEGAAFHPAERTAVIADVHLGYEWARAAGGDCVPAHSLAETLSRLALLFDRCNIHRLIVAGDLVESAKPCRRTAGDVRSLIAWVQDRGARLLLVPGNHDPRPPAATPRTHEVDGWTIGHGHQPIVAPRSITGHIHPVLRVGGVTAPCFLVGERTIVLPAFSPNAAGLNVVAGLTGALRPQEPLRCIAAAGGEILDFGPIGTLAARLTERPGTR